MYVCVRDVMDVCGLFPIGNWNSWPGGLVPWDVCCVFCLYCGAVAACVWEV